MMIKTALPAVMAVALLAGAGCKKSNSDSGRGPDQLGTTAVAIPQQAPAPPPAATSTVATYPDTVPQSGTKQLLQPFTVYQAADSNSPVLTHVSVGQWINLKGSRGNWMLIEWPSGVGQMSPGWIELRGGVSDSRLAQTPATTAPVPPPPPVVSTAPPPPPPPPTSRLPARGVVLRPRHH